MLIKQREGAPRASVVGAMLSTTKSLVLQPPLLFSTQSRGRPGKAFAVEPSLRIIQPGNPLDSEAPQLSS